MLLGNGGYLEDEDVVDGYWPIGGAGVILRDFGRSFGMSMLDFWGFGLTWVIEKPGTSGNIDVDGWFDDL